MAEPAVPLLRSVDQFLAWEEQQADRYELVGGVITLMAGGTENHDLVSINAASALNQRLRGSPCRVHVSDVKVHVDLADDQHERRQRVCEAMFYLGELALARGDKRLAGRHFALATRMKIIDYVEHDLALGEIARLRAQASSDAHLPAAADHVLVAR